MQFYFSSHIRSFGKESVSLAVCVQNSRPAHFSNGTEQKSWTVDTDSTSHTTPVEGGERSFITFTQLAYACRVWCDAPAALDGGTRCDFPGRRRSSSQWWLLVHSVVPWQRHDIKTGTGLRTKLANWNPMSITRFYSTPATFSGTNRMVYCDVQCWNFVRLKIIVVSLLHWIISFFMVKWQNVISTRKTI